MPNCYSYTVTNSVLYLPGKEKMDPFLQEYLLRQRAAEAAEAARRERERGAVNNAYFRDDDIDHANSIYMDEDGNTYRFGRYDDGSYGNPLRDSYAGPYALGPGTRLRNTRPLMLDDRYGGRVPFAGVQAPVTTYVRTSPLAAGTNWDGDDDGGVPAVAEIREPTVTSLQKPVYHPERSDRLERCDVPRVSNEPTMFVLDRFGNLRPYRVEKPKRKELDANDLIRLLLGGREHDTHEDTEAEASEESIAEREKEEKEQPDQEELRSETPLTRKSLANLLTKLTQPNEGDEEQVNRDESKDGEGANFLSDSNKLPFSSFYNMNTPEIPRPQFTLKKSAPVVPVLNVHKSAEEKKNDEKTNTGNENNKTDGNSNKPSIIEDVKVSAPQFESKDKPFSPELNLYEFKTKYIAVLSLPGVSKEFVEIDYHPTTNELVVHGEIKNKYLSEDDAVANSFVLKLSEQRFGSFKRIIKLPSYPGVDDSQIKARFINGMLEIKIPKLDESQVKAKPKKIVLEDVPDEELERESQRFNLVK